MENGKKKRGRGRPLGSPNKNTTFSNLKNNRELVKSEVAKKAGLFVVKQMQNLDALYNNLSASGQAKLLVELMKYSTTTANQELIKKNNDGTKKEVKEIKIVYDKPQQLPQFDDEEKVIDIESVNDSNLDINQTHEFDDFINLEKKEDEDEK